MTARNKYWLFAICLLVIVLIGWLDRATGFELNLGPFYLIPLGIGSWYLGRFGAFSLALAVILMRAYVDINHPYTRHWVYYWNAFMRIGLFLTFAICIRRISSAMAAQREIIKELSNTFEESWRVGGLFPVCTVCKNTRTDAEYAERVKSFMERYPNARFVHSVCPDCATTAPGQTEEEAGAHALVPHGGARVLGARVS
jgi:hypothetical protein